MFRFLKCCCDIVCPPCPAPNANLRGWTSRPLPGCPQCPGCPPCPAPYQSQTGYTDGAFLPNCPRCPKCEDDPCYRARVSAEICPCIPLRLLCVFVGVSASCSCFENTCPPGGGSHAESSGSLGSYCDAAGLPITDLGIRLKFWGNDGPGCAPPATLINDFIGASISFGAAFGAGGVHANASATIGGAVIFQGAISGGSCKGPWVIPNTVSGCFVHQPLCDGMTISSGGQAILYPCGC